MTMTADMPGQVPWWKEPTKDQWIAWIAAWLGWTLDAFDFTIFLLIMVPIAESFHVPLIEVTAVFTITLWLRLVGAVGSRPADATGSRPADVVGAGAGPAVSRGFDDRFFNDCFAPPPAPFDALTRREVEVLRCMAAGIPRRAIAERLVVSPNTVRTHARNVLAKLGVHSSLAAAALLRRVMCAPAG